MHGIQCPALESLLHCRAARSAGVDIPRCIFHQICHVNPRRRHQLLTIAPREIPVPIALTAPRISAKTFPAKYLLLAEAGELSAVPVAPGAVTSGALAATPLVGFAAFSFLGSATGIWWGPATWWSPKDYPKRPTGCPVCAEESRRQSISTAMRARAAAAKLSAGVASRRSSSSRVTARA